ncbi:MAG: hypothetical protein PHP25_01635, partial [Candidatus Moranbacteria bacterium]|nr:hypothetical protein [Candidatus Moranbacteria bacterium]
IISSALESVGLTKRKAKDEEIKEFLEKREDLRRKLKIAGYKAFRGSEQELETFLAEYHVSAIAIRSRAEEDKLRAKNSKWWPGKALVGFANISKNYRDFVSRQFLKDGKLSVKGVAKGVATAAAIGFAATSLIAASLPALGIVAVGSAGASAAAIWRGFSAVGAGYAAKKRMEAGFIESKKNEVQQDVLRQIEALKNKTEEEWIQFIEGMESGKSIGQEEQSFAAKDRKHRLGAFAISAGVMTFGTIMSHYVVPYAKASDTFQYLKGFVGNAWDKIAHSFGGEIAPEKIEKPFLGGSHRIKSGENVWKVTRDMYIDHAKDYKLDPNDPKIKNLFHSLKKQGFLSRMGINADNFNDLSDSEKIKILAENKTANAMEWYKSHHGGKLPSSVKEGYIVTLDDKGKLFVGDASQSRAGAVHHEPTSGGGKATAAAEHHVRGGGRAAESVADQKMRAAEAMEARAKARWEDATSGRPGTSSAASAEKIARLGAEARALNEQAVAGITSANARLWNNWLENLGGFQLDTPASDIQESIGRLSPGITSDMPIPPTADEMIERGGAIAFTQETFQKFPPLNARETMQQYLERMSRTNFNLFKALSIKNRL